MLKVQLLNTARSEAIRVVGGVTTGSGGLDFVIELVFLNHQMIRCCLLLDVVPELSFCKHREP